MHKWMTDAHKQETQVIEEAQAEIMNLKKGLFAEILDLNEDSHARIHW